MGVVLQDDTGLVWSVHLEVGLQWEELHERRYTFR